MSGAFVWANWELSVKDGVSLLLILIYNGNEQKEENQMPNIEGKMNNIKSIQKGKIPKDYRIPGGPRYYQTEYEKYNAVYKEIDECCEQELNIIEVLLENEIETGKRLNSYKGILPIVVTLFASLLSVSLQLISPFISLEIEKNTTPENTILFTSNILGIIAVVFVAMVSLYFNIDSRSSKKIQQGQYLLYILMTVKKKRGIA